MSDRRISYTGQVSDSGVIWEKDQILSNGKVKIEVFENDLLLHINSKFLELIDGEGKILLMCLEGLNLEERGGTGMDSKTTIIDFPPVNARDLQVAREEGRLLELSHEYAEKIKGEIEKSPLFGFYLLVIIS